MAENVQILTTLLDDCWEPQSAIEVLRNQAGARHMQLAQARAVCLLVPEGVIERARLVDESATIDDRALPGRTRYLWVLAAGTPSHETLLRLYEEHGPAAG